MSHGKLLFHRELCAQCGCCVPPSVDGGEQEMFPTVPRTHRGVNTWGNAGRLGQGYIYAGQRPSKAPP